MPLIKKEINNVGILLMFSSNFSRAKEAWIDEYLLIGKIWSGKYPKDTKRYPISFLEKFSMTILIFIRSLSVNRIKDLFSKKIIRSAISESYVIAWLFILTLLLWLPEDHNLLIIGIVIYRIVDGVNYRLCILFVDRYKEGWGLRSLNRSLILLLINYLELIVGFAILYLGTKSIGSSSCNNPIADPSTSLYFSLVTITTLGYGDYGPIKEIGQWLVVCQTLLGFILVVLIIGSFLTGLKDIRELLQIKTRIKPLKRIYRLKHNYKCRHNHTLHRTPKSRRL